MAKTDGCPAFQLSGCPSPSLAATVYVWLTGRRSTGSAQMTNGPRRSAHKHTEHTHCGTTLHSGHALVLSKYLWLARLLLPSNAAAYLYLMDTRCPSPYSYPHFPLRCVCIVCVRRYIFGPQPFRFFGLFAQFMRNSRQRERKIEREGGKESTGEHPVHLLSILSAG